MSRDGKKHRKNNRRLNNFIIPMLMLLVIAVALIFGTVMTWQVTLNRMKEYLREQAQDQAVTMQDKLDSKFAILTGLATSFTRVDAENSEYIIQKLDFCAKKTDFEAVMFADTEGNAYSNSGKQLIVADRWYFKQCMNQENALQRLKTGRVMEEPHFVIAVPVMMGEDVIGVLIGDYADEKFRQVFAETSDSDVCDESYICSADGDIIAAMRRETDDKQDKAWPEWSVDSNIYDQLNAATGSTEDSIYLKATAGNMRAGGEMSYECYGEMRYAMFEPMDVNDWYILTILSQDKIHREVLASVRISYVMLGAVLLGIAAIVAYLFLQNRKDDKRTKEEAERLRYILEHDDLTGLLSEKTFQRRTAERLTHARPEEYCIIYMDVYKFKLINELFGYEKGDELLKVIAAELQSLVESCNGLCGRIGGDKFVLLLPNRKEIIQQFYTRKTRKLFPVDVYAHYGIYIVCNVGIPVATMIDCAQLAQKLVKGDYDNYVSFYNEQLKQQIIKEQKIVNSMAAALNNGEFVIYLQPQYNYRDGSISGAEALVRWNSPTGGLIPPGDFIPIFETNGFIVKLDENVWEQACRLLRQWLDAGRTPFPISVNVSRADLLRGSVADKLKALIDKYELTADLLRVEITESAYMDNPQQLIMEIQRIREYGFLVEMDDFGSGYSSLNMLKDVPINVLKTDLKFLDTEGIESRRDQILDSVIRMAHQIGLSVVAEGVETKEQADYLVRLDCEIMQGYYFSKPVPVYQFEQMAYGSAVE